MTTKSSLSKIVRTYIEQAKDGSTNNYSVGSRGGGGQLAGAFSQVGNKKTSSGTSNHLKGKASGSGLAPGPRQTVRVVSPSNENPIQLKGNPSKTTSLNNSHFLPKSSRSPTPQGKRSKASANFPEDRGRVC